MNVIQVLRQTTVTANVPGIAERVFQANEIVRPDSIYYYPLLWSGNAFDTGLEDSVTTEPPYKFSRVVVSENDPSLAENSLWIQTFPNSNDFSMWIKDPE